MGDQEAGKWLCCRVSPIGVRVLSPTPGSPARGSGIGKMSSKSSCLWKQVELELHRNGGNRESTFEGCTQVFRALGPTAKQQLHWNLEQTYLQVLEDLLGQWRSTVAHSWSKKTSSRHPREYSSEWGLPVIAILAPRHGSIQQSSVLECLRPNNPQGGNNLSADRQSPPINTPLAMTLPTRGKRPGSTHQWAGTHPSH